MCVCVFFCIDKFGVSKYKSNKYQKVHKTFHLYADELAIIIYEVITNVEHAKFQFTQTLNFKLIDLF